LRKFWQLGYQNVGVDGADTGHAQEQLLIHKPHRAVFDLLIDLMIDLADLPFEPPYACLDISANSALRSRL